MDGAILWWMEFLELLGGSRFAEMACLLCRTKWVVMRAVRVVFVVHGSDTVYVAGSSHRLYLVGTCRDGRLGDIHPSWHR